MRLLILIPVLFMLAACADGPKLEISQPAPAATAKQDHTAFECLHWPVVELIGAVTKNNGVCGRDCWAVIAELGEPSQTDCACKLAAQGRSQEGENRIVGHVAVPEICGMGETEPGTAGAKPST